MRADKRLASVLLQSQPSQATERIQVPEGADDTIRHIGNPAAVVWATFATPPGSRPSPPVTAGCLSQRVCWGSGAPTG